MCYLRMYVRTNGLNLVDQKWYLVNHRLGLIICNPTEWQKDGCCGYQLSMGSLMDNVIWADASVDSDLH